MTPEIAEAIEAACSVAVAARQFRPLRRIAPDKMRARIKEFLRNLPEGMTVQEVLDEL